MRQRTYVNWLAAPFVILTISINSTSAAFILPVTTAARIRASPSTRGLLVSPDYLPLVEQDMASLDRIPDPFDFNRNLPASHETPEEPASLRKDERQTALKSLEHLEPYSVKAADAEDSTTSVLAPLGALIDPIQTVEGGQASSPPSGSAVKYSGPPRLNFITALKTIDPELADLLKSARNSIPLNFSSQGGEVMSLGSAPQHNLGRFNDRSSDWLVQVVAESVSFVYQWRYFLLFGLVFCMFLNISLRRASSKY